jgi:hypothetical protein
MGGTLDIHRVRDFAKGAYKVWKWFLVALRWCSIIFFGVLFFVGLYFKLPWKVLVCLAVIPVVGVCVPKKIQPWVWGALTVLILSVWGWVHLPEQNSRQWQPYQYRQELLNIKRDHLPRGIENAADRYEAIFDEYDETIFYFSFQDGQSEQLTLFAPWDPDTYPSLDIWISKFEPAIRQIVDASEVEQCRFDIPYDLASMKPQLKRINQVKGWAQLLIRSANRDRFSEHQQQALPKLLTVPRMAQHLYQQQTLFDQAGAFHVELMGARALEAFMVETCDDPSLLAQIEDAFGGIDPQWPKNWPHILKREKLTVKNLAGLMYEVNSSGSVRISHNSMIALQRGLGYRPQRLFINQQRMNRLAVIGLWLSLPSNPQRLATVVDERFDHYSLQVQKGEQLPGYSLKYIWIKGLNFQSVIDWLAMQQVRYYWALDGQFMRHEAVVNQIRIFSALKKYFLEHKQWPERLAELEIDGSEYALTDPVNGKPFVYERLGEGFRLYSLGDNGVDDGGLNDAKDTKDDILLWPRIDIENNGPHPDKLVNHIG